MSPVFAPIFQAYYLFRFLTIVLVCLVIMAKGQMSIAWLSYFFLTIFGDTNNYLGVCMCDLKKGDSQIFYKGGG